MRISGDDHYCGPCSFDSHGRPVFPPETIAAYNRIIADWHHGRSPSHRPHSDLTIAELLDAFSSHAETYYTKRGRPTAEQYSFRQASRVLRARFADWRVTDFGPVQLADVRKDFLAVVDPRTGKRWTRGYVNEQVNRVRRIFARGVEWGLVPQVTLASLKVLPGLRKTKTDAPEGKKVRPVSWSAVESTLPFLRPILRSLIPVHRLLGCRADEICSMRPCDLERFKDAGSPTGEMWRFKPASYKTEAEDVRPEGQHYWIGAQAQGILAPLLGKCPTPESPVFPASPRGPYRVDGYGLAVRRAVKRANRKRKKGTPAIEHWSPGQMRHLRLTEIKNAEHAAGRKGTEAAQAVGGHSEPTTTMIYSDQSDLARRIMRDLG